jgi:hypothetical protein
MATTCNGFVRFDREVYAYSNQCLRAHRMSDGDPESAGEHTRCPFYGSPLSRDHCACDCHRDSHRGTPERDS